MLPSLYLNVFFILVLFQTYRSQSCKSDDDLSIKSNEEQKHSSLDSLLGVGAVLIMVTISGFSATYFEAILKTETEKVSIWERNFQLALYSTLLLVIVTLWDMSGSLDTEIVFFQGWTINTVIIALIQVSKVLIINTYRGK